MPAHQISCKGLRCLELGGGLLWTKCWNASGFKGITDTCSQGIFEPNDREVDFLAKRPIDDTGHIRLRMAQPFTGKIRDARGVVRHHSKQLDVAVPTQSASYCMLSAATSDEQNPAQRSPLPYRDSARTFPAAASFAVP